MAVVFMLLGPVPYIKVQPSDQLIYGMTCLSGLGYTLVMVSTFRRCQSATVKLGFLDDMKTKILITGATSWQTTFKAVDFEFLFRLQLTFQACMHHLCIWEHSRDQQWEAFWWKILVFPTAQCTSYSCSCLAQQWTVQNRCTCQT